MTHGAVVRAVEIILPKASDTRHFPCLYSRFKISYTGISSYEEINLLDIDYADNMALLDKRMAFRKALIFYANMPLWLA